MEARAAVIEQKPAEIKPAEIKPAEIKSVLPKESIIKKEDFTCPITNQFIMCPVVTPCGHLFEEYALGQWIDTKPTCPSCNKECPSYNPAPVIMMDWYHTYLKQNPELEKERCFNLSLLEYHLKAKNVEDTRVHKKLVEWLIKHGKFNEVSTEPEYEGITPVTVLAAYETGCALLKSNPSFVQAITPESLNAIAQTGKYSGASAVTGLASCKDGISVIENHALCSMISELGLNSVLQNGVKAGCSAVTLLFGTDRGIDLFAKNVVLRNKISTVGLNAIAQQGKLAGASAVTVLASFSDKSVSALFEDAKFCKKISVIGANAIRATGEDRGISFYFCLALDDDGIEILKRHKHLRSFAKQETLLNVIPEGEYAGESVATRLKTSAKGRELIAMDYLEFGKKLTPAPDAKPSHAGLFRSNPPSSTGLAVLEVKPQLLR